MQNPWCKIPNTRPYYLEIDSKIIQEYSLFSKFHFDVLPNPYIGSLKDASLVLLALNPGFKDSDLTEHPETKLYLQQAKLNLLHKSKPPFYFFNEKLDFTGGNIWWSRILKSLIDKGITKETLSKKIMCIQYFPYASEKYSNTKQLLPSQHYSFRLVNLAISQKKQIIIMRSESLWLKAVPNLRSVNYMKLKNPRNPVISPKNLAQEEFGKLVFILNS